MENKKLFIVELKALLQKYNASINMTCSDCSDLHGVYDEKVKISIGGKVVKTVIGWSVRGFDL